MGRNHGVLGAFVAVGALAFCSLWSSPAVAAVKDPVAAVVGRWDMTVTDADGKTFPSWLQVVRQGDASALSLSMVGRVGSVSPVPEAAFEGGDLVWKVRSGGAKPVETIYRGKRTREGLEGTVVSGDQAARAWQAVRAPAWRIPAGAVARRKLGKAVALFNGADVTGWLPEDKSRPLGWVVKDGALDNQGRANNIYSDRKFTDFKLEIEFSIAANSNSGIYLRGRHEIQVLDDAGKPPESHGNGAVYGFLTPTTNASRPAGQWQTLQALLVGNRVTVILNGTTIIDDQEIPGITGGALDSNEGKPGPIMLQGDHGPVTYRKVVVTPFR